MQNAYDTFFNSISGKRKGPRINAPKFKSRKIGTQSYKTINVNNNIQLNLSTRQIKLPKVGWVKFRDPRKFSSKIRSVTVSRDPAHRFYVSILIDKTIPTNQVQPNRVLGLDMSMTHLVVDSNGTKINYPRYFRRHEIKLAWEQRKLSRKQRGSKTQESSHSYRSQKIAVAKVHAKISDSRKDFLHKLSTQITNEYDAISIESLNMKGMAGSLRLGKSVNDLGWGLFVHMLEYKSLWKGKTMVKIPKFFPSSKQCSGCGYINRALGLSERSWVCSGCGMVHDRDINAAENVRDEGVRILGQSQSQRSTVGITGTGHVREDVAYAQGDCVRPEHVQDSAKSVAMSGNGDGLRIGNPPALCRW